MTWFKKQFKKLSDMFSGRADFFKEGTEKSMMRYLSLACVRFGFAFGFTALILHSEVTINDVSIVLGSITIGVTGKAYQKAKELKTNEGPISSD
jgi:hypothetical protein